MKWNLFGREVVRDTMGRSVGFIEHTPNRNIVCEPNGRQLGFTQNGGTFDNVGNRVLQSDQPAYLLGKGKKSW